MPPAKILPPSQLPTSGVTDIILKKWIDQLKVYLLQYDNFAFFMEGGRYSEWSPAEEYQHRIRAHAAPDAADDLNNRRTQLRTLLSIVARYVQDSDYDPVIKHSTSLEWVFNKLREDYDIRRKGIHFLNIIDLQYDATTMTPTGFYNTYRSHFINNLRKTGDVVAWKSADALQEDERMTPILEDTILLMVINLIDSRLLAHIRETYAHQMGAQLSLRDFKTDILVNIPKMLTDISTKEAALNLASVSSLNIHSMPPIPTENEVETGQDESIQLGAIYNKSSRGQQNIRSMYPPMRSTFPSRNPRFQSSPYRTGARPYQPRAISNFRGYRPPFAKTTNPSSGFCRVCQLAGMSPDIVSSHRIGDPRCTNLSFRDKQDLNNITRNSAISVDNDEYETTAQEHGYIYNEVDHEWPGFDESSFYSS